MQQRLISWKAKHLTLAARNVLVNPVVNAIPLYTMQTTKLPVIVCDDVAKSARNFLWGGTNEKKKIHLLAWKNVYNDKAADGLGIRHLRESNRAFMMKNAWSLTNQRDELWVEVLRSKYKCGGDLFQIFRSVLIVRMCGKEFVMFGIMFVMGCVGVSIMVIGLVFGLIDGCLIWSPLNFISVALFLAR